MEETLAAVQDGTFAREWINENRANRPAYKQLRQAEKDHEVEAVGENLRTLFAWGEVTDEEGEEESTDERERQRADD